MASKSPTANVIGPGKAPVGVKINGQTLQAEFEPSTTLLDAMREYWNLTGAKRVCDRATCGACTVLLDGVRVYACSILAIDVGASEVTTIESLPDSDPVKQAFVANDAMQCGFCTPGFVMSCKGFQAEYPNPTADDMLKGMGGNICRCGSYAGIQKAVSQVVAADALAKPRASNARPPKRAHPKTARGRRK
jgi:xanthine dehydrogenase YagT iron-sulfur-binding subunit